MKEIEVNGKKYSINEIPYLEAVDIDPANKKEMVLKLFKASLGLTEEEISKLTIQEGKEIEKSILEVNGLDFQTPANKEE